MAINVTAALTSRAAQAVKFLNRLQGIKNNCVSWLEILSTRSVRYDQVVVIAQQLAAQRAELNNYITPATRSYLQAELGYDLTPDLQAIGTEISNIITWVRATVPFTADGYIKERKLDAQGTLTFDVVTSVESLPCQTALSNIIALVI